MKKFDFTQYGRDSQFRSAPFWAWNGKMDPAEVRRQINIMHDMGMGGFYMHSRMGLATEYMSEEWFEAIKAGISEGAELGMEANLYDEDRWPSGAGGGFVTADRKYRIRYLEIYEADAAVPGRAEDVLECFYYAIKLDSDRVMLDYRPAQPDETVPEGYRLYKVIVRIAHDQLGFNNASYLDTCNPEAVQAFIDFTHEKYFAECGKEFGRTVPYFFTDEPNYLDQRDHHMRPWSERLPELFLQQTGSAVTGILPELFFNTPARFLKSRYHYYRIMTELFAGTFMKMIGEWCEKHNIQFTGHLLLEDDLTRQLFAVGAAMPGYEYMQMPGIDILTEKWLVFNTVKQAASVAHQLGKKRVLSETYGCTGWDFPLAGHKALGDWQYALGVNYRCQHLYWYSMRGQAKRDYPASIGGQSPWCEVYAPLEDYFGRLSELLSSAGSMAELLVLHPVETMWGCAGDYNKDFSFDSGLDLAFNRLGNLLVGNHIEFDYGDESLMAKHGRIDAGKFIVGKAAYRGVYLPEVLTLRRSTLELLREFAAVGGKVYYSGNIPQFIDGVEDGSGELQALYSAFIRLDRDNAARVLANEFARYSIKNGLCEVCPVIACHKALDGGSELIFAANPGCEISDKIMDLPMVAERKIALDDVHWSVQGCENAVVRELDLYSGKLSAVEFVQRNGELCWQSSLQPLQSRCYIIGAAADWPVDQCHEPLTEKREVALQEHPAVFSEKNLLVLDHVRVGVDGKVVAENEYVLLADQRLRKLQGLGPRGGSALQPWKMPADPNAGLEFELTFEFECKTQINGEVHLIMENPELFDIELNGKAISRQSCGFWCDPALEKVAIDHADLQTGKNSIKLRGNYSSCFAGFEAIYLYGDFGVENLNTLTELPAVFSGKALKDSNMPFYSGNTVYSFEFELERPSRCRLEAAEWFGSALKISIDNDTETVLYSPPYCVETALLPAGKHLVQVTVYGHRRNAFGPFYSLATHGWIGPYEFVEMQSPEKVLVPMGMTGKVRVFAEQ